MALPLAGLGVTETRAGMGDGSMKWGRLGSGKGVTLEVNFGIWEASRQVWEAGRRRYSQSRRPAWKKGQVLQGVGVGQITGKPSPGAAIISFSEPFLWTRHESEKVPTPYLS